MVNVCIDKGGVMISNEGSVGLLFVRGLISIIFIILSVLSLNRKG